MNPINDYLSISSKYGAFLGGLRWSQTDDALELGDGQLFIFKSELALFLEGFDSVRPLVPFGYLLRLLHLLGHGQASASTEMEPFVNVLHQIRQRGHVDSASLPECKILRQAYQKAGRMPRNAGVLCALLCLEVPAAPGDISCQEIILRLAAPNQTNQPYPSWTAAAGVPDSFEPPLEPMAFAFHIEQTLRRYAANELEHVLRHGSWPLTGEGRRLSELVRPPQTLATILASLAEAPRLARAIPFVSQLVSALSIPPRRLAHTELPIGGYADIVSRGQPEQLLPSQFALEMDEFTRRFAENELLYFRREEPPASQREELVLLLDQGVRTWGIVRSLLSAAALALVKQAARRKQQLWLAGTSNGGKALEALGVEPRKLCQLIEASDLSANPGLALETVLESRSDGPAM